MALIRGRLSHIPVSKIDKMHPSTHFSALSSWVLLIAKAIDSYGFDSRELFAKAGLDYNKLRGPVARFSFPAVARLWQLATETTRDPSFGLSVASYWHPTTRCATHVSSTPPQTGC